MKDFFKRIFTKDNMKKFFQSFIWLMLLVFVIDIVSKWAVVNHFGVEAMSQVEGIRDIDEMIPVIPKFLYIGGSINDGAAFSLKVSSNNVTNRIVFICISVLLSAFLIGYYIKEFKKLGSWYKVAFALMISGAVGNLIDRAFYWNSTVGLNGVIDWIQVIFPNGSYFAMFNIADSALVVGVGVLIVLFIIEEVKDIIAKSKEGEYKYSPKEREEMNKDEGNQSKQ